MMLCCFSSWNRAHIPLMIHAGVTNSNVGHHSWPHRLCGICHSQCWQIWPNVFQDQRPAVDPLHQFSSTELHRRCHICDKIGANVTRQLKSLFSSDSLHNPKGQVLPWQQLALSWAGKAYKNMITWVKKTNVCAKYVRKEHTRHSDSSAALKV